MESKRKSFKEYLSDENYEKDERVSIEIDKTTEKFLIQLQQYFDIQPSESMNRILSVWIKEYVVDIRQDIISRISDVKFLG